MSQQDKDNWYYLPTEEEWEYAARARDRYWSSASAMMSVRLVFLAGIETLLRTAKSMRMGSGRKRPNPWGLHDVHGNIWEWMDDWYYGSYSARPKS